MLAQMFHHDFIFRGIVTSRALLTLTNGSGARYYITAVPWIQVNPGTCRVACALTGRNPNGTGELRSTCCQRVDNPSLSGIGGGTHGIWTPHDFRYSAVGM